MLVYFSANARDVEKYDLYRSIIKAIQKQGGILIHGWLEVNALRGGMPSGDDEWWDNMASEVMAGIKDADVVVLEATGQSSLGVGYEMAMALSFNKPVLALLDEEFNGGSYIQGVRRTLLDLKSYTPQTIDGIVAEFLTKTAENHRDL